MRWRTKSIYIHIYIHNRRCSPIYAECCRGLQIVVECCRELQSVAECCRVFLRLPRKRVWYVQGLQWKHVANFGSCNYFKSDLLRPWHPLIRLPCNNTLCLMSCCYNTVFLNFFFKNHFRVSYQLLHLLMSCKSDLLRSWHTSIRHPCCHTLWWVVVTRVSSQLHVRV